MTFVSLMSGIALESANDAYFSPERTERERAVSELLTMLELFREGSLDSHAGAFFLRYRRWQLP